MPIAAMSPGPGSLLGIGSLTGLLDWGSSDVLSIPTNVNYNGKSAAPIAALAKRAALQQSTGVYTWACQPIA